MFRHTFSLVGDDHITTES